MPAPLPLPIRVLSRGASLTHDISERPPRRAPFTWGRAREESLLHSGHAVTLHEQAVASQEARHLMRDWEANIKAFSPDVVVLTLGYYEPVHLFLPRWLERHANSLRKQPGPIRSRYRHYLLRPVWKSLARLQRRLDRRVGPRGFGWKVRRAERNLRAYIDATIEVGHPLILLFEFIRPGARGRDWFPGMEARIEQMNVMMRKLVASYDDPDIRLFPIPEIIERRLDPAIEPNQDGFHYIAEVHQFIGEELAEEIRTWVKDYPRLAPKD